MVEFKYINYNLLKGCNVPPINIEIDTTNVKPFIIINLLGILLFSKSDIFINPNDIDIK